MRAVCIWIFANLSASCSDGPLIARPAGQPSATQECSEGGRTPIAAGTYALGCDDPATCADDPPHSFTTASYDIDRRPVLTDEYLECVDAHACPAWGDVQSRDHQQIALLPYDAAAAFCGWRGGALPTDDQWEAAGRGPARFRYPWGNEWDDSFFRHPIPIPTHGSDNLRSYWRACDDPRNKSSFGVYDLVGLLPEYVASPSHSVRGGFSPRPNASKMSLTFRIKGDTPRAFFRCAYTGPRDAAR